ncbi:hypothetical protein HYU06_05480 [Candidatus Woesearchaeota archaeon]|nr:hypothetical protein [Candidatus Woesearchaeota archaeon]
MFSKNIQDKAEVSELNHDYVVKEKTEPLKRQDIKDKEEQVKKEIVLQPKISKIKNKVHQEVQNLADKAARENYDDKVAVVLQLNDANSIPKISEVISSQGGNVKAEFSLGAAITADLPSNKIQALAKENSVESIWPDREYEMLLDDSHDIINIQAACRK